MFILIICILPFVFILFCFFFLFFFKNKLIIYIGLGVYLGILFSLIFQQFFIFYKFNLLLIFVVKHDFLLYALNTYWFITFEPVICFVLVCVVFVSVIIHVYIAYTMHSEGRFVYMLILGSLLTAILILTIISCDTLCTVMSSYNFIILFIIECFCLLLFYL